MQIDENKPCLVQTGQGFSVKYKEKFLYSKYEPKKAILSVIQKISVLQDSLVLCFSPLLGYGLLELLPKIPENCLVLGIEKDDELFDFSTAELKKLNIAGGFRLLSGKEAEDFQNRLAKTFNGEFRRVVRLDFSAAVNLNRTFYDEFFLLCQNIVNQFWKNRLTLVKFGRNYSGNLFKNLRFFPESRAFFKVEKPILVVGAGESAWETLSSIKKNAKNFYIIAVDASLQTFRSIGIKIDAAVCEESQSIIAGCFKGCKDSFDTLFLSLTANPNVAKLAPQKNVFYVPVYSNALFIKNLIEKKIEIESFLPLGSVGLSALQIALKLRAEKSVPIFVTGLDFSYSLGASHIKSSFHENSRREKSNRLNGIENFSCSLEKSAIKETGKNGASIYTNPSLIAYRTLFVDRFGNEKNIFDAGKTGLELGLPKTDTEQMLVIAKKHSGFVRHGAKKLSDKQKCVEEYFSEEKKALLELKEILTGKTKLSEAERNERILEIINPREYLYLHFPDGTKANLSLGFLKRVRTDLEYFLKIFSD